MGAPQSGADIYRDGKKMRAAPKERTRKEYGRRLTAGGNARAPQSGAEAEPPQSGGHIWGRETKAGPPQRRERLGKICGPRSPTGRAGTVIGMGIYGPACKAGHI